MSGRYNSARQNLTYLQELIRKDPESYRDDFHQQYRHYQQTLRLFQLQPDGLDNGYLQELIGFVAHVSQSFPKESKEFGQDLVDILKAQAQNLDPELRLSFCKALVLLRNRKLYPALDFNQLVFDHLLKVPDKSLRKFLFSSLVTFVKKINTVPGRKDPKLNLALQNSLLTRLKDSHAISVRTSLLILIECFRRQLWRNAKCANAIAQLAFHPTAKIKVAAMKFMVGAKKADTEENEGGEDSDEERGKHENAKTVKEIALGYRVGKKTKKRQKLMAKAKSALEKEQKRSGQKKANLNSAEANSLAAIRCLYDPQEYVERLFRQLERSTDRFEVKLLHMALISKCIHLHDLILLPYYPFLQRYLQPHQREVTHILLYAAQAAHSEVPPDAIQTLLRGLLDNFVTDRNSAEVITVGLNTAREILAGCPLAADEDVLRDLTEYKKYRNKNVAVAARSLIQLYRQHNPKLLHRRDRGQPTEATKELRPLKFGQNRALLAIPGAECLANEEEGAEENDDEDELDDEEEAVSDVFGQNQALLGSPGAECLAHNGEGLEENGDEDDELDDEEEAVDDEDEVETRSDENEMTPIETQISSDRPSLEQDKILTEEDFRRIAVHQLRKRLPGTGKNRRKRPLDEEDLEDLEEELGGPTLAHIEHLHKRPKQDKDSRLRTVASGRDGREKFGRPVKKDKPHAGRTNRQNAKGKQFQMVRNKHQKKKKRSFGDKQRAFKQYLMKQKKMK